MPYIQKIRSLFGTLAFYIACHPWKICIISFLMNGLLGLGMLNLPRLDLLNNNIENVYLPRDPPTRSTAKNILEIFKDHSGTAFYTHQIVKQPIYTEVIIWRRDKQSLINDTIYEDINLLMSDIKNISIISRHSNSVNYQDICARRNGKCVVNGEEIIEQLPYCKDGFLPLEKLQSDNTAIFEDPLFQLADFKVMNNTLLKATYLRVRFNLRQENSTYEHDAKLWTDRFISHMKEMTDHWYKRGINIAFSHQMSYLEELGNDTFSDIPYFSFVFTIYFIYLGFAMSGGNMLTVRSHIGRMGIIVLATSVLGAWGLLMACEIEFTNAIGIAPIFLLGHQVTNTMITLSHLSDASDEKDPRKRVEYAVKMSVIPITITMMCHAIPFTVAIFSKYYAMELVGIYVVTTLLFNYVNHFVFYTSCLAIHEQRINSGRHCCICTPLKSKDELEGRSCCIVCCCSGIRSQKRTDMESSLEKLTRNAILRLVMTKTARYVSVLSYLVLLAFAIWGLTCYKVDAIQENEVLPSSYFYKWNEKVKSVFPKESTIQFVALHPCGYLSVKETISDFEIKLKSMSFLQPHRLFSWNNYYEKSQLANYTTEIALTDSVQNLFLPRNTVFANDIRFAANGSKITATRFYIKSKKIPSTKSMILLKKELFNIADETNKFLTNTCNGNNNENHLNTNKPLIKVHSPDFIHTDYWLHPLWELIKFAATQLGLLVVLLLVFKPAWSPMILIPLLYLSMTALVFGLSHFLEVYLTQVSMIVYMMAGSFFIEIIVHIFYSFFEASGINSRCRINVVLSTASQSLFHVMFGQFLGLLVLFVVKSYVFVTFFRITLLTLGLCVIFAVLLIPTLLSVFGPTGNEIKSDSVEIYRRDITTTGFVENTKQELKGVENLSFS